MNRDISSASSCYGLYDEEKIVGFIAVIHTPHPVNKKIKRCHRLVILPDYQGIGLGTRFLSIIADLYKKSGFDFSIVTSAKNMVYALRKSPKWALTTTTTTTTTKWSPTSALAKCWQLRNCKRCTFFWVGNKR